MMQARNEDELADSETPPLLLPVRSSIVSAKEIAASADRIRGSVTLTHNLTSILNSPRWSPTSRFGKLKQAAAAKLFRLSGSSGGTSHGSSGETRAPIPCIIQAVEFSDFADYLAEYTRPIREFFVACSGKDGAGGTVSNGSKEEAAAMLSRCRTEVPAGYFSADFIMDAPTTFSVEAGPEATVLQEKLSGWLDIVEVCLWQQITSQAGSFFGTLIDLRKLNGEVSQTLTIIAKLRELITSTQKFTTQRQLRVLRGRRRRRNVASLQQVAALVQQVRQTQPTVTRLMELSDYSGALALIENTQLVLRTQLSGVHCLRTLGRQLEDFKSLIGETMASSFIQIAVSWQPGEQSCEDDTLGPLMRGLLSLKAGRLRGVLQQYRARTVEEVKLVAKTVVAETLGAMRSEAAISLEYIDDTATALPATLDSSSKGERERANVEQLLALSGEDFLSFLTLVFEHLLLVLQRAHAVHSKLIRVLKIPESDSHNVQDNTDADEAAAVKPTLSTEKKAATELERSRITQLCEDSKDVVGTVGDLAQRSVKQLLIVRLETHAKLRLEEFKEMYNVTLTFVVECERLSGKDGLDLRGALLLQAKRFLSSMHERQTASLRTILDNEEWKQADVPVEIQRLVNRLTVPANSSPIGGSDHVAGNYGGGRTARELTVLGRSHRVVGALQILINAVAAYIECASQFPVLASLAQGRLIEILRLFNERTNRLVYCGDACRTARLKRINTKNLALASQSLTVVLAVLPGVAASLEAVLPPKHISRLRSEFEQVRTEYTAHRERVYHKFVEVFKNLLEDCCRDLPTAVNWDARSSDGLGKPQDYMARVVKGIESMFSVLHKHLPSEALQSIFESVFDLVNKRVPELFAQVRPVTPTGRSRVRVDINHLLSCLRRLRGLKGPGDSLERQVIIVCS